MTSQHPTSVIHRRKRGFFGWLFLLLFILWNLIMLLVTIFYAVGLGDRMSDTASEAERAGAAFGSFLVFTFIILIWAAGAVVTGLLAMVTRGGKTVVTQR